MARGSVLARDNKHGSRTYYVKYRAADGTQIKRAVGESRRQAERALTAALAEVDSGRQRSAPSRDRLGAYLERWLDEHRAYVEAGTHAAYAADVRLRLKPRLGDVRLDRLAPGDVRRVAAQLRDQKPPLAAKTINNTLVTLKAALNRAVADGLIPSNPAAGITLPAEHREMDYLRLNEIPAYIDACSPAYRLLASCCWPPAYASGRRSRSRGATSTGGPLPSSSPRRTSATASARRRAIAAGAWRWGPG